MSLLPTVWTMPSIGPLKFNSVGISSIYKSDVPDHGLGPRLGYRLYLKHRLDTA